jgi:hypothetical protein
MKWIFGAAIEARLAVRSTGKKAKKWRIVECAIFGFASLPRSRTLATFLVYWHRTIKKCFGGDVQITRPTHGIQTHKGLVE